MLLRVLPVKYFVTVGAMIDLNDVHHAGSPAVADKADVISGLAALPARMADGLADGGAVEFIEPGEPVDPRPYSFPPFRSINMMRQSRISSHMSFLSFFVSVETVRDHGPRAGDVIFSEGGGIRPDLGVAVQAEKFALHGKPDTAWRQGRPVVTAFRGVRLPRRVFAEGVDDIVGVSGVEEAPPAVDKEHVPALAADKPAGRYAVSGEYGHQSSVPRQHPVCRIVALRRASPVDEIECHVELGNERHEAGIAAVAEELVEPFEIGDENSPHREGRPFPFMMAANLFPQRLAVDSEEIVRAEVLERQPFDEVVDNERLVYAGGVKFRSPYRVTQKFIPGTQRNTSLFDSS